jgi:hypothetical protein
LSAAQDQRDPIDIAEEFVAAALTGEPWECRDSDGQEPCWVERGVGKDTERFIETPLSYLEACKIEVLLQDARDANGVLRALHEGIGPVGK